MTYDSPRPPVETAVLLPGAGSDEVFVTAVFAGPLAEVGLRLTTPVPVPGRRLADQYLSAMDEAATTGPVLVGGISFGAQLAAEWAVRNPDRCAGLLLALPAWHGAPDSAPAARAALASAAAVDANGLDRTLADTAADAPPWLAAELDRAWRRYGTGLADSLRAAAGRSAPTLAELRRITVPVGIAACADDPVHPMAIAREWARALPVAELGVSTLAALGADRESLGRAAADAWRRAAKR
ncbi:MAG TPA: alpha/beta hydrolase [Pseudonocardiaceae bacterium]|nr:alpha/beta hydrolase [Pseudonocardiaceae bacterium]